MIYIKELLAIIFFVYILECIISLNDSSVVFYFSPLRLKMVSRKKGFIFGNKRLAVLNVLFPIRNIYISQLFPFSISPAGICNYNGQPASHSSPAIHYPFEAVDSVSVHEDELFINKKIFLRCQSKEYAEVYSRLILNCKKLSGQERENFINDYFLKSLDLKSMDGISASHRKKTVVLMLFTNAYWLYFFLFIPFLLVQEIYYIRFEPVLFILLFFHFFTLILFSIAFTGIYRKDKIRSCFSELLKMLFSPFYAVRANAVITKYLFRDFHPIALLLHFGKKEGIKQYCSELIIDLKHPVSLNVLDPEQLEIYEWYSLNMLNHIEAVLKKAGYSTEDRLSHIPHNDPAAASYCPRCLMEYTLEEGYCQDCTGVQLKAINSTNKYTD